MGSGSLGSAAARLTESLDMDELPPTPMESKLAVKMARSKKLDIALANDGVIAGSIKKLLLLGAGGSGKSTIFKQMKVIYGLNYSEAEKKRIAPVIYRSVNSCSIQIACVLTNLVTVDIQTRSFCYIVVFHQICVQQRNDAIQTILCPVIHSLLQI